MKSDRRKLDRYRLNAPVICTWVDSEGVEKSIKGVSRDMSGAGIFVCSEGFPPVGGNLLCQVFLPALRAQGRRILLSSTARVRRVVQRDEVAFPVGFALDIQSTLISCCDEQVDSAVDPMSVGSEGGQL